MQRFPVNGVYQSPKGENGLMGMALHPDFSNNHWIYLYYTAKSGHQFLAVIERYVFLENELKDRALIFETLAGKMHYGGRMAFGPDNFLYFTSGDAGNKELAQATASLAGKILRIKDNGDIPEDNPFNNAIFSYGHRNPQGITWDDKGNFWETEHGEAGIIGKSEQKSGLDEINLIKIAGNYGWPDIRGVDKKYNITPPIAIPASGITWAPAGLAYYNGYLFFGGLRGKALYQAKISPNGKMGSFYAHFENEFGRVRAVKTGPDGYIYFSTSNRDQKGADSAPPDKIFRIPAEVLIKKYP
ncbi:hypothetical protein A3G06_02255 [Candidatus Nomurabacteria bacterium RIFCSPLOWO2_12_FULL_46_14]|uniref:Glucose/Sorbosone dehydrogenase domain-containing protein n=1 Tax=Candidatus Nomurabacteria bacterium RIFCSPLOWO2_12_FULL_46_14 TaxID=1801797 RepID=A0A1F6Y9Q4_9BACT|nr:MAG: hypothetical protein A3G06_02255 [Candidatus Nomurabacteria bacterium RIFCSPLOWO2_12_FULL_46_14]